MGNLAMIDDDCCIFYSKLAIKKVFPSPQRGHLQGLCAHDSSMLRAVSRMGRTRASRLLERCPTRPYEVNFTTRRKCGLLLAYTLLGLLKAQNSAADKHND